MVDWVTQLIDLSPSRTRCMANPEARDAWTICSQKEENQKFWTEIKSSDSELLVSVIAWKSKQIFSLEDGDLTLDINTMKKYPAKITRHMNKQKLLMIARRNNRQ